jgi:hypothetical protein
LTPGVQVLALYIASRLVDADFIALLYCITCLASTASQVPKQEGGARMLK